ncbi:MAG: hypothetical protein CL567_03110 [Alphaproteobacteria bacterium]|nr:hypothetical protein [Alphaproteobacteria bacterium]|tara:strand:- start:479 stop:1537 length:1059 start_codon:yes stop_codon:yes gene_type:complete
MKDPSQNIFDKTSVNNKHVADSENNKSDPEQIICACANLKLNDFERMVRELNDQSFGDILIKTEAGNTCTACLLDLEYFFVKAKSQNYKKYEKEVDRLNLKNKSSINIKQQFYKAIDSIAPPIAWAPTNFIPIIKGSSIETWLTITNHDLLFSDRKSAPIKVTLKIRDKKGRCICKKKLLVGLGDELKLRLDKHLTYDSKPLTVGAAYINTHAVYPAMRGTIRPQFEILAPKGACALHAQGDVGPGDTWFTVQNRPNDQRLFFVLVNTFHRPQSVSISLPFELYPSGLAPKTVDNLYLPAHGTEVYEINCDELLSKALSEKPFSINVKTERSCRVYLLCGSANLDQFSIDHR